MRQFRIIDRTMVYLGGLSDDKPSLSRFLEMLIEMETDVIEMSEATARMLTPLPERPLINIVTDDDTRGDPMNTRFNAPARYEKMAAYKIVNNNNGTAKARIHGLDNAICGDYLRTFARLRKTHGDDVEFCPYDRFNCATALAVEWLTSGGGGSVVTAFCGTAGLAATEEVIMALRVNELRGADRTYKFLPEMTALFQKITGKKIRRDKPVTGSCIFHVESGVHVDGIIKHPASYEPFPPDIVGLSRKIILGKQSGSASVRAKLSEHNIVCNDDAVPNILDEVKTLAVKKNAAVTDNEFADIARRYLS